MPFTPTLYDTSTLAGVYRSDAMEPPTLFWAAAPFFGRSLVFDTEFVDFEMIDQEMTLAPLVVPTAQGVPMTGQSSKVSQLKPAYLKPKNVVQPHNMIRRAAGAGELVSGVNLSPQARFDAAMVEMARTHLHGIMRRWEQLASQAILNGTVTLSGDNYPTTIVDFERAPGHTITLGAGARWGDVGVRPIANINSWINLASQARFGGVPTLMVCGSSAWDALIANQEVKDLMDKNSRQTSGTALNLGVGDGSKIQVKGNLSANLTVVLYTDYYEAAGVQVPYMDPRDVLLAGPGVSGAMCFGAILDLAAGIQATPIFGKSWDQEDPSGRVLMTQSAPLPVPVRPNATLRARVVA